MGTTTSRHWLCDVIGCENRARTTADTLREQPTGWLGVNVVSPPLGSHDHINFSQRYILCPDHQKQLWDMGLRPRGWAS